MGDVNGDWVEDLIVGASRDDTIAEDSGSAHVFSGADGSTLYNFYGDSEGGWFGTSVSGAGDVNGDGFDDVIVGTIFDFDRTGSAQVFSGSDGSILYDFAGDSTSFFGQSTIDVGDVNGDGLADFVIDAPFGGANDGGYARLYVSQIVTLGDCDLDGEVTFQDITPFVDILVMESYLPQADIDQNGAVDFLDIAPLTEILSAL